MNITKPSDEEIKQLVIESIRKNSELPTTELYGISLDNIKEGIRKVFADQKQFHHFPESLMDKYAKIIRDKMIDELTTHAKNLLFNINGHSTNHLLQMMDEFRIIRKNEELLN